MSQSMENIPRARVRCGIGDVHIIRIPHAELSTRIASKGIIDRATAPQMRSIGGMSLGTVRRGEDIERVESVLVPRARLIFLRNARRG